MDRVTHFEIPSDNPEQAMKFYTDVFGWTYMRFGNEQYWLATTGPDDVRGINGAIMKKNHPQQPLTNNIRVNNIDSSIKMIEASGGTIVVPKTTIPGVGWFAYFTDPDKNIMGVMQEDSTAQ